MDMFNDMAIAVTEYPVEHVQLRVFDFKEPGRVINTGEICSFKVRVENNGQLDLRNLKLHLAGSEFASVALVPFAFAFSNSVLTSPRNVDAHQSMNYGPFWMRANALTPGRGAESEDLFSVHLSRFDLSLHHILIDHPFHSLEPGATYNREIKPKQD